jgi:hypothetical protein
MEAILFFLESLKVARKQSYKNLTLFPLLAPQNGEPAYLTLEEALAKDLVQVQEASEAGSVPELLLLNRGAAPILIVEGEELVGAKQNRIVNATFLIPGKTEMKLPVSCVEHGRWAYTSHKFAAGERVMHASLRSTSQRAVSQNIEAGRGYASDQCEIWDDIHHKVNRLNVHAPTSALSDVFEGSKDKLGDYLKHFSHMECQAGAIFAINDKIAGMDCFGFCATFGQFFEKLVKSYALDAIDWEGEADGQKTVSPRQVRGFLDSIGGSKASAAKSPGLGENVRLDSKSLSAAALVHEERLLHLAAFKKQTESSEKAGFGRFSQRRSFRGD